MAASPASSQYSNFINLGHLSLLQSRSNITQSLDSVLQNHTEHQSKIASLETNPVQLCPFVAEANESVAGRDVVQVPQTRIG